MKIHKHFDRVDLESVLRSNSDGMPIFRKCFHHETLLSFYDDAGNSAFKEWWDEIGSFEFAKWCNEHSNYNWLIED